MPHLAIDNLFARRSIRKYTDEPVSRAQLDTLLQAAMAAPSAGNRKPWQFVVVTDPALLARLAEPHPHGKMLPGAPLCIVPCGVLALAHPDSAEFWVQDLSAATQNILLAATGLGLGAVWCGVHPVEERVRSAREILGIPPEIVPFAYIAIGRPAEDKPPRTQYDAERVHVNRW